MKKIYIIAIISAAICGILLYSFFSGYEKKVGETKTKAENQQKTEMVVVAGKNIYLHDAETAGTGIQD